MRHKSDPSCRLDNKAVLLRHPACVTRDERSSEVVETIFSVAVPLAEQREQKEMQAVRLKHFFCLSSTDIQSSSHQGEHNAVIPRGHWQAITQNENWMAVLIPLYPRLTRLICVITAKLEVCVLMHLTFFFYGR